VVTDDTCGEGDISMVNPVYEHDCNSCIFLGNDDRVDGEPDCNSVDLYAHISKNGYHTLIRGFSSKGNDYRSLQLPSEISLRWRKAFHLFSDYLAKKEIV
jgi:hypothetical protein